MPTFPSTMLRQKLSWLGIPETEQTFKSLLSMLPAKDPSITDVNSAAEVLIYLIGKNIIHLPSASADALIRDISYGGHICQFYRNSDELITLLTPFFRQGLERNHKGIWIVSVPLNVESVIQALKAAGMESALNKKQIEVYSADVWYASSKGGLKDHTEIMQAWADKEQEALDNGFNGLRITGDTRFVVTEKDWKSLMEYEAKVHGLINNSRMLAICTYTFAQTGKDSLKKIINSHNEVQVNSGDAWHRINTTDKEEAEQLLSLINKHA